MSGPRAGSPAEARKLLGGSGKRGALPGGASWMAVGAAAIVVAALLLVTGIFAAGFLVVGTMIVASIGLYAWSRSVEGARSAKDRMMSMGIASAFALAMIPLASLLWTVISKGINRFDVAFFTESARGVIGAGGGASHAIVGTLVITGIATLISVPIGLMAAIYLNEYGGTSRLRRALTFFVDVMTGIPSIVAGLFAYALFAIFFGPGIRMGIMGAVALSVLMIPVVVRSSEEMLRLVPNELREASYALGVPKWLTIVKVVMPTAIAGITTGIMLSISRVIGETAPLLITAGVTASMNYNLFEGRMMTLPVFSYSQYMNQGIPAQAYIDRAWSSALVL